MTSTVISAMLTFRDSSHQLATIAHLDVVPAGDGWATPTLFHDAT